MQKYLQPVMTSVVGALKRNRQVADLLYSMKNANEFSDIYEHEKMLADAVRCNTYHEGIRRHVRKGDVVVDLGTGTGLLALFAAQNDPAKVYAIDHSEFIEVARKIAQVNGAEVEFVKTHSRNFSPSEKVDVIVHEQIGDDLFNENMVENLLELKKRILKESGIIIPGKFEVFLEPVVLRKDYQVPFLWNNVIHGIDFACVKDLPEIAKYQRRDYMVKDVPASAIDHFMCDPEPILAFDLNTLERADELPKTVMARRKVTKPGMMDGLLFYFRVIFDERCHFDTSPFSLNTSWGNFIFRLDRKEYRAGDQLSYDFVMNDIMDRRSWAVRLLDRPFAEAREPGREECRIPLRPNGRTARNDWRLAFLERVRASLPTLKWRRPA